MPQPRAEALDERQRDLLEAAAAAGTGERDVEHDDAAEQAARLGKLARRSEGQVLHGASVLSRTCSRARKTLRICGVSLPNEARGYRLVLVSRRARSLLRLLAALSAAAPATTHANAAGRRRRRCGQRGKVVFDKDTILSDGAGASSRASAAASQRSRCVAPPARRQGRSAHRDRHRPRLLSRCQATSRPASCAFSPRATRARRDGHVWIACRHARDRGGRQRRQGARRKAGRDAVQPALRALAECSALTLTPPTPPGFSMPGAARVFLMKVAAARSVRRGAAHRFADHDAASLARGRQRALLQHRAARRLRAHPVPRRRVIDAWAKASRRHARCRAARPRMGRPAATT